jgi:hypothetical protein
MFKIVSCIFHFNSYLTKKTHINVLWCLYEVRVYLLSDFKQNRNVSTNFGKNSEQETSRNASIPSCLKFNQEIGQSAGTKPIFQISIIEIFRFGCRSELRPGQQTVGIKRDNHNLPHCTRSLLMMGYTTARHMQGKITK